MDLQPGRSHKTHCYPEQAMRISDELNRQMTYPTPYADVNALMLDLTARIQGILGSQFVGLYLYGSLALGGFDPQNSDIDFITVTQSELPDGLISALRSMHGDFDRSSSPWAGNVEAAYIPLEALKRSASTITTYPQVEKGTKLFLAPLEDGWAFQRHTLREKGLVVSGPDPATFIEPVDRDEMRQGAVVILSKWQQQARQDAEWIAWVRQSSDSDRKTLIRRALAGQHDSQPVPDSVLTGTLSFLDEALDAIKDAEIGRRGSER